MLDVDSISKASMTVGGGLFGGATARVQALNDIILRRASGTTLAIVGESGCGKSTLAKVLSGLTEATAGEADARRAATSAACRRQPAAD